MTEQPRQQTPYLTQAIMIATLRRIGGALPYEAEASLDERTDDLRDAAVSIATLHPRDATETALAARLVVLQRLQLECFRRANQPGLPDALRLRTIDQAITLCRLEDSTMRTLRDRQRAEVVAPVAVDVPVPTPRAQAPYVAPVGRAARKPETPVATARPVGEAVGPAGRGVDGSRLAA